MINNGYVYRDRVPGQFVGQSVLDFYAVRYPRFSPTEWRKRIEAGQIRMNDQPVSCNTPLKRGDDLSYHRSPWKEPDVPLDFEVYHVDDHILVAGKPAGLPVLPGDVFLQHSLLYLVRKAYGDSCTPMHRLDRGTSGLVLFARTRLARKRLGLAMQEKKIQKTYIACVSGNRADTTQGIQYPIGLLEHPITGKAWGVAENGRPSHTRCRFMGNTENGNPLVMTRLLTGRPHQIRIHLSAIGNPLVGDPMYGEAGGKPGPEATPGDIGFFLHAWRLRFTHPVTGERLRITHPLPEIRGDIQHGDAG